MTAASYNLNSFQRHPSHIQMSSVAVFVQITHLQYNLNTGKADEIQSQTYPTELSSPRFTPTTVANAAGKVTSALETTE